MVYVNIIATNIYFKYANNINALAYVILNTGGVINEREEKR